MDPHMRPWGVRPILDPSIHPQHHKNLTYQPIFAARITNLLEQRQQIYKRALLDQLYRLRQLVVSATGTGEHTAQPDCPPPDALTENSGEGTSDTPTAPIALRKKSLLHDGSGEHSAQHSANSTSSPHVVTEVSSSDARISEIPHAFHGSSRLGEELPAGPSHLELANSASSTFHIVSSASISCPLEINIRRFPALNDVISTYRYFNEMSQGYSSTLSPFFVTYTAAIFLDSARAHHQPHSNTSPGRQLNFRSNPQQVSSRAFRIAPKSLNLPFAHIFPAPFYCRRYIPPLLARLFFEQELALLFDSQLRYTFSAEAVSLTKATDLYTQQLLPTRHTSCLSHAASGGSQLKLLQASTGVTPINRSDGPAKTSFKSPSSALFFPKELHIPHDAKTFQRRTFYHSMTRTAELRAPPAAWRDDTTGAHISELSAPSVRSHYAYAVSSDVRGLPSYMNLEGVHSGDGKASVTLAFGFQRRTNYPFRRTYNQPRTAEKFSAPPKIPPRVCGDFASRVPVNGLSSTLLHLFQPDVHRGLFFGKGQDESLLELEDPHTEKLYSINAEGKLVEENAK